MNITGLHHLTAISGDPARNVRFYNEVLGLRLVKRTVNFDDPGTWHLYYGDHLGSAGTILTFFPFANVPRARPGAGEVSSFAFQIPVGSTAFWRSHLDRLSAPYAEVAKRFGEHRLQVRDPDGFRIDLVETSAPSTTTPWQDSPIPPEYALQTFHGATLLLRETGPTGALLTDVMGAHSAGREIHFQRFILGRGPAAAHIDLERDPAAPTATPGAGSVHHIAWRTPDDESQLEALRTLRDARIPVSPVRDRFYFNSIYFREPGGVLFEVATDPPGFQVDETIETLGTKLKLPPEYEPHRDTIAAQLPSLKILQ